MGVEDNKPTLYQKLNMNDPSQENLPAVTSTKEDSSIDEDFTTVQKNLQDIIETGQKAFDDIVDIATQSQDAEAYTTVASLMNSLVSANRELLDSHRRKQIFKQKESANASNNGSGNTNILNVTLTTAELAKMINGVRNNGS